MERVRVVLRVRPNADGSDDEDIVDIRSQRKVVISKPGKKNTYLLSQQTRYYEYTFDHIFPPNSGQETVYNISTCNFLKNAISNGINLTVFVYGATGTGKTYTIIGNEKNPGIVIRGINETFEQLFSDERFIKDNGFDLNSNENNNSNELRSNSNFFVTASYMEIYNETIRDLLNPSNNSNNGQCSCEILEDQSNIQISNLTQLLIENSKEGIQALNFGNKYRKIEQTAANNVSSRSHAIFQLSIFLEGKKLYMPTNNNAHKFIRSNNYKNEHFPSEKLYKPTINNSINPQLWCKISFIDLAGSERASATQNRGIRLTEGAHINRSLLALANCINSLALSNSNVDGHVILNPNNDVRYHVKYRDSKLTHILKNSLEGEKCFVVMIANISPSSKAFEESHNTLKYANRAKNIKVKISNQLFNENEENYLSCTCNCHVGINTNDQKAKSKKSNQANSSSQTIICGLVKTEEKKLSQQEDNYGLNLIQHLNNNIYDVINFISEFTNQISNKKVNETTTENSNSILEKENNSKFQQNDINYSEKQINRASFVSTLSNDENHVIETNEINESIHSAESFIELQSKMFSLMTDSLKILKEIKLEYSEILNNEALLLKKIQDLADDFSTKRQKKYTESVQNQ